MDRARAARGAAAAALVLLAVGCTGERADEPLPGVTLTGAPAPTAPATTAPATTAPGAPGSRAPAEPDRAALTAVVAAEAAVPGSRAYSLDLDDEGYVVKVVADGATHEAVLAPDGGRVLLLQSEDDELDDDERAALGAAEVGMAEAMRTALGGAGGTIEEVELERAGGDVVWTVQVRTPAGAEDRTVDAVTGTLR